MRTIYSMIAGLCIISSSLCAQEAIMSVTGTVIDQTNRNFTSVMVSFMMKTIKRLDLLKVILQQDIILLLG